MSKLLKGNFEVKVNVDAKSAIGDDLEAKFEKEALKRLGGSIAFVSKKKILWPETK